eukprot:GHVU01098207.1.p1 GENE.GHVU01098207.1~~GHVU01098207.1.p1  ORF type:complete len:228 (+),score=29.32 GHVU01098207.1:390-1073(+)
MHTHTCTHTHTHTHMHTCTRMHTHASAHIHACRGAPWLRWGLWCAGSSASSWPRLNLTGTPPGHRRTHTHTPTCALTHTHMHTYICVYIQTQPPRSRLWRVGSGSGRRGHYDGDGPRVHSDRLNEARRGGGGGGEDEEDEGRGEEGEGESRDIENDVEGLSGGATTRGHPHTSEMCFSSISRATTRTAKKMRSSGRQLSGAFAVVIAFDAVGTLAEPVDACAAAGVG